MSLFDTNESKLARKAFKEAFNEIWHSKSLIKDICIYSYLLNLVIAIVYVSDKTITSLIIFTVAFYPIIVGFGYFFVFAIIYSVFVIGSIESIKTNIKSKFWLAFWFTLLANSIVYGFFLILYLLKLLPLFLALI